MSGGTKFDNKKEKLSLISSEAMKQLARVMEYGSEKYGRDNWRQGFKWSRLFDAGMRHLLAYNNGERKDPETGLSHLAHAMANIAMLIEHEEKALGEDDLFKGYEVKDEVGTFFIPEGFDILKVSRSEVPGTGMTADEIRREDSYVK